MLLKDLKALYLREVATLERELDLYPSEANIWKVLPGMPNTAGTLFLHLAGSLQFFFGATFGESGYVRDRQAEFNRRNVPRINIREELSKARQGVLTAFDNLTEDRLEQTFPVNYADADVSTQLTLLQFLSHLDYHLGQIDYHCRAVTGDNTSANAIAPLELL